MSLYLPIFILACLRIDCCTTSPPPLLLLQHGEWTCDSSGVIMTGRLQCPKGTGPFLRPCELKVGHSQGGRGGISQGHWIMKEGGHHWAKPPLYSPPLSFFSLNELGKGLFYFSTAWMHLCKWSIIHQYYPLFTDYFILFSKRFLPSVLLLPGRPLIDNLGQSIHINKPLSLLPRTGGFPICVVQRELC